MEQANFTVTLCDSIDDKYRFGFNGQEKVNEIAGVGNHNTALFWEYDTRLGRRWNLDPLQSASLGGYVAYANNPIYFVDINGDKERRYGDATCQYSLGLQPRKVRPRNYPKVKKALVIMVPNKEDVELSQEFAVLQNKTQNNTHFIVANSVFDGYMQTENYLRKFDMYDVTYDKLPDNVILEIHGGFLGNTSYMKTSNTPIWVSKSEFNSTQILGKDMMLDINALKSLPELVNDRGSITFMTCTFARDKGSKSIPNTLSKSFPRLSFNSSTAINRGMVTEGGTAMFEDGAKMFRIGDVVDFGGQRVENTDTDNVIIHSNGRYETSKNLMINTTKGTVNPQ